MGPSETKKALAPGRETIPIGDKELSLIHIFQDSPDWEMAGIYADEGITGTSLKK